MAVRQLKTSIKSALEELEPVGLVTKAFGVMPYGDSADQLSNHQPWTASGRRLWRLGRRACRYPHKQVKGVDAMWILSNRQEAGKKLAAKLLNYRGRRKVLILALPRGGVPVAYQIASALNAPLDVLIVRKLGVPGRPELAMGAVASGGVQVLNEGIVEHLEVPWGAIEEAIQRERMEIERRERSYRGNCPVSATAGQTVIVVDDGVATGATMRAALTALRKRDPAQLVVAVPTAAPQAVRELAALADEVVCLATPDPYLAVGRWYREFPQTSDAEVRRLLEQANLASRTPDGGRE